ncbi:three-helix bundle dimerization domain-containing protein [Kribbella sp. CA-294648]|uniref:three-helix bundle dimerization domain-containing protein n=1 Tax=Kribbella sp. CA-294648 TaxID=3239948 RepID=UPI003D8EDB21
MNRSEEERAIAEAAERLMKVFPDISPDTVERAVAESRPEFDGNPIRDFVPLFVERAAKHRLRSLTTSAR